MRRSLLLLAFLPLVAASAEPLPPKAALQPLNDLVGAWKCTGEPLLGTKEEKLKGFWVEHVVWEWQFKGDDACLKGDFAKGKHFASGELRYLPATQTYRLTLTTLDKKPLVFEGPRQEKKLLLEREDAETKDRHKVTLHTLHVERHLMKYEVLPAGKTRWVGQWQVGATNEAVPFAAVQAMRECVVSGGLGTTEVKYKDQTYYVCCSGCRDAFKDNPEKYFKEFEARKKQP